MITSVLQQLGARYKGLVFVGLSGGMDSVCLLHMLREAGLASRLRVLHIHHGLNPAADSWSDFCMQLAGSYGVHAETVRVDVENQGQGTEAAARDARYRVFSSCLKKDDVLLTAHHQDDQIETFMLRLLRGSGLEGLSAMSESRALGEGTLLRPLLGCSRAQLREYATLHSLEWVDDDSNEDRSFDRNYLRHEVLPVIESRWPAYRTTIGRAIDHIRDAAEEDQDELYPELNHRLTAENALKVIGFEEMSRSFRIRLIRLWLSTLNLPSPSGKVLNEVLDKLITAREDSEPAIYLQQYSIRRYKSAIYALPLLPDLPAAPVSVRPGQALSIAGAGQIQLVPAVAADDRRYLLAARFVPLEIRFRSGGERITPVGRQGSRDLKRLMQEYRVEPWWRDRTPLCYWNDQLVMAGDLCVADGFQAAPGEPGFRLRVVHKQL